MGVGPVSLLGRRCYIYRAPGRPTALQRKFMIRNILANKGNLRKYQDKNSGLSTKQDASNDHSHIVASRFCQRVFNCLRKRDK